MIQKIQKNMNKKGFTLVELIIVIAVMAILAAIVIPRMLGVTKSFKEKADERTCETYARVLQTQARLGKLAATGASTTIVDSTVLGESPDFPQTAVVTDSSGTKVSKTQFYYCYVAATASTEGYIKVFVGTTSGAAAAAGSGVTTGVNIPADGAANVIQVKVEASQIE